jgi:hypothetical protein
MTEAVFTVQELEGTWLEVIMHQDSSRLFPLHIRGQRPQDNQQKIEFEFKVGLPRLISVTCPTVY